MAELTYPFVGATRSGEPQPGYRLVERSAIIGHGDEHWIRATEALRRWGVKTRAGFRVEHAGGVIEQGQPAVLLAGVGALRIREPVLVVYTVEEPTRVGYAYGTLRGHPLRGEELFVLERSGDEISMRVRSYSRPANLFWWALYPALRMTQDVVVRRYLAALEG